MSKSKAIYLDPALDWQYTWTLQSISCSSLLAFSVTFVRMTSQITLIHNIIILKKEESHIYSIWKWCPYGSTDYTIQLFVCIYESISRINISLTLRCGQYFQDQCQIIIALIAFLKVNIDYHMLYKVNTVNVLIFVMFLFSLFSRSVSNISEKVYTYRIWIY